MAFRLEVKEEAKQDMADAMQWYASKSKNLDLRFFSTVQETVFSIQQNPFAFKKIYKTFRQTAVRVFPYVIIYEVQKNLVTIYAVFNTWQHPKKKLRRLKK
jgi:mRNA-degrading endonuclease RelE of RelBE toxin-antitoxin system